LYFSPFYSLYTAFRNMLWNEEIVIVIGTYSFRDISVNNALKDFLNMNDKARIILTTVKFSKRESTRHLVIGHELE
jgi:hypothetical protein